MVDAFSADADLFKLTPIVLKPKKAKAGKAVEVAPVEAAEPVLAFK